MFGRRRRRPLLGAAVLAGTATVAARHGAQKQASMEAERQFQAQQAAELRRLEEERQQRSIDRAVSEALAKQQQSDANGQNDQPRPTSRGRPAGNQASNQYYGDAPPLYPGRDPYSPQSAGPQSPYLHPSSASPSMNRPRQHSTSSIEPDVCFCPNCGTKGSVQHRFCAGCGQPMRGRTPEQQRGPEKQVM